MRRAWKPVASKAALLWKVQVQEHQDLIHLQSNATLPPAVSDVPPWEEGPVPAAPVVVGSPKAEEAQRRYWYWLEKPGLGGREVVNKKVRGKVQPKHGVCQVGPATQPPRGVRKWPRQSGDQRLLHRDADSLQDEEDW